MTLKQEIKEIILDKVYDLVADSGHTITEENEHCLNDWHIKKITEEIEELFKKYIQTQFLQSKNPPKHIEAGLPKYKWKKAGRNKDGKQIYENKNGEKAIEEDFRYLVEMKEGNNKN